jgi:DNA-binding FadR family transcriptional regulator
MQRAAATTREQRDTRITAKRIGRFKATIAAGAISPGSKFPPERQIEEAENGDPCTHRF